MKVLKEGHRYLLNGFENTGDTQEIQFIEKVSVEGEGVLQTVYDGTTNEEVLVMLIDRMNYLQEKAPCKANAIVITNLEESLMWLNKRTRERVARGVEGTNQK